MNRGMFNIMDQALVGHRGNFVQAEGGFWTMPAGGMPGGAVTTPSLPAAMNHGMFNIVDQALVGDRGNFMQAEGGLWTMPAGGVPGGAVTVGLENPGRHGAYPLASTLPYQAVSVPHMLAQLAQQQQQQYSNQQGTPDNTAKEKEMEALGESIQREASAGFSIPEGSSNDRNSQISLDEVQQQLTGFRYNSSIMRFLKEQVAIARGQQQLGILSDASSRKLDAVLKKGDRLIKKHSMPFDIRRFYRICEAVNGVELLCEQMTDFFPDKRSLIASVVPGDDVDRDRRHLYVHLAYVLKGRQCDFGCKERFRAEWESIRKQHERRLTTLNVIADADIVVGQSIGEGGYGLVHKAKWGTSEVAVKKLKSAHNGLDISMEEFASVFNEVSTHALLNHHPCIVRLYGITRSGWTVMELADGDLSLLRRNKMAWSVKLDILEQAASGLVYVHSRQPPLIHGDVKDTNLLYIKVGGGKYDVKLADFGLTTEARRWETDTVRSTRATSLWKAPELYDGNAPSLRSDVFSFGLVMHAVMTGRLPYGRGTNELAVMRKKLDGQRPCSVTQHDCPLELCELMERCVAKVPEDRPTMCEVAKCLSNLPREWQAGQ
ncbi:unnamed protein product [Ostreobium quekettii]|uniref:Protein kinase domain-containing protein n=1 Tax=Ostreobium quekettii TaxID=121088 RepID=A0A8S1JFL2_9CHLO|nr:unnamed protein product [Ostreobium quekettii]